MTTRLDVSTDFFAIPQRVAEVAAPSVEFIMQDVVDTLRSQEASFKGMSFPSLLDAFGKQDLGGGVKVGITVALQNTKVSFEGRTTPAQTGSVTATSASPIFGTQQFTDSGADFVTAQIARGSLVINFDDNSIAEVVEVLSATQLRTKTLVNGTSNTYTVTDAYHVFNIVQCTATGGNLVSVDENQLSISQVLPTAFTQVVITASSSATLSEQQDVQYASFNGGVSVDLTSPYSGTAFPSGTQRQPVNNMVDALAILVARGFGTLYIVGDATIDSGLDYSNLIIVGESKNKSSLTVSAAANVASAEFLDATVIGDLDGNASVKDCVIGNLNYISGFVEQCVLSAGTIELGGGADAFFLDCWSGVPGAATPIIDLGGSGQSLVMRNYNGGIRLINKTGAEEVSIDLNSGQIIIDDTVTNGVLTLRGVGKWSNKSTYAGGATVVDELVSGIDLVLAREILESDQVFDQGAGILHYYRRGTTVDLIPPKTVVTAQTQNTSLVE